VFVRSLQLEGFRNLASQRVEFDPGLNLLVGDNGQGKTNTLEALHLLSSLRSFRPVRMRETIARQASRAELQADLEVDGAPLSLRLVLEAGGRRTWVGEKPVRAVEEYLGRFQAVAFTPDDLSMIKGAPIERRRFLDRAVFLHRPVHLLDVRDFHTALKARNLLLRSARLDPHEMEAFSHTLAQAGARLTARRIDFVRRLEEGFRRICEELLGRPARAGLALKPGWQFQGVPEEGALRAQLQREFERDRARGLTCSGPHLDDLIISLDARPARRHASQGQQRAVAIGLLLCLVGELVEAGGPQPVLLLDDVSSELDEGNRRRLFERVTGLHGQVFVTTTDPRLCADIAPAARRFRVVEGRMAEEPGSAQ
jgi:DNA replication and repair protein RecF